MCPKSFAAALWAGLTLGCWAPPAAAERFDPTSPYTLLELVPTRTIRLPGVEITVGSTVPDTTLPETDYDDWIRQSASAVRSYFGRFPVSSLKLALLGTNGQGALFGNAYGDRGAALRIYVGTETNRRDLMVEDWVLVHEMVHTAVPRLEQRHHWLEEGVATYVESVARLRAGLISAKTVWGGFAAGMPAGLPRAGESGLDSSGRWGNTYWGGALFCLLADYEMRKRTNNRRGLQQALGGLVQSGASIEQRWPVERVIAVADRASGTTVLAELYRSMGQHARDIDLDELWTKLGVVTNGEQVEFNDSAPAAHIRHAIGQRVEQL